jgi:hypothetical protein
MKPIKKATKSNNKKRGIQNGPKTHNQDQWITPQSFRAMKSTPSIVHKPGAKLIVTF